jgi:hypothetical protein
LIVAHFEWPDMGKPRVRVSDSKQRSYMRQSL